MTYEDIEQKDGSIKRNYTIISGDTFNNSVKITKYGLPVNPELIEYVKFKLADTDYKCLYCDNFIYNSELELYYIDVPADIIVNISENELKTNKKAKYIYEYELKMSNNNICTIMQATLTVTRQIGDCAYE